MRKEKVPAKSPASKPVAALGKLFERGAAFVKGIQPSDRVLLIHHTDVDGYCSAAITLTALKLIKAKNVKTAAADVESLKDVLSEIGPNDFDKMIVVDIDAPMLKPEFERIGAKTLIIDHHMIRTDLNSKQITYINPRFSDEEIYQPASYVVYKLLSSFMKISGKEWLAVLGTVGDFGFEDCRDILGKYMDAKSKDEVTKTKFWAVGRLLYGVIIAVSVESSGVTPKGILEILSGAKDIDGLAKDKTLVAANEMFEKEYERCKAEFWKNAETRGGIIIGTIGSPLRRLGSALATDISIEQLDKIIMLLEKRGESFKAHARCQSGRVHLGKLMEKCCHGGGHRHAAGGSIEVNEVASFKARIFRELGV